MTGLEALLAEVRVCRICRDGPEGPPLPHEPRPVLQASPTARLLIAGQAPGTRVHLSGRPFTDPSGDRLRAWLGIGPDIFYDARRIAILPMGFCFPGLDGKGSDLPPRPECARHWRHRLMRELTAIELVLAVGQYAQGWHLGPLRRPTVSETVAHWREGFEALTPPVIPLPHPSWRNNAWIARHPWFASELLPVVQREVKRLVM
jgi:uracil-DNA glycosylase